MSYLSLFLKCIEEIDEVVMKDKNTFPIRASITRIIESRIYMKDVLIVMLDALTQPKLNT